MSARTICQIDDAYLIDTVTAATTRLVFAAPGVSQPTEAAPSDTAPSRMLMTRRAYRATLAS